MKKAVMYGAGNIGRGFIGKIFSESGYEVCFLDIDSVVIQALCEKRSYTVHTLSNDVDFSTIVGNVYGVDAKSEQAITEIATCDIMATAVGVNVLPLIVPNLALAIKKRININGNPLNILLAENQIHADKLVRRLINQELSEAEQNWANENLGLVEVSIGRMVPPLTLEEKKKDPLYIAVEPYCDLPADSLGFKGEIPNLIGLMPFTPFDFYTKRKLFLHNMGHAICAYLGFRKGYTYVNQGIEDPQILEAVSAAMKQSVEALHNEFPLISPDDIEAHRKDLLKRFGNKVLKDTITRVAADPIRKLRNDDRLIGAALYCLSQGIVPDYIVPGIVAAYQYNNPLDQKSIEIQQQIEKHGLAKAINIVSGIENDSVLGKMILEVAGNG